jgi:hypothetical protein
VDEHATRRRVRDSARHRGDVLGSLIDHERVALSACARGPLRLLPQLIVLLWDETVVDATLVKGRIGIALRLRGVAKVDHGAHAMRYERAAAVFIQPAELIGADERPAPHTPSIRGGESAEVSDVETRTPRERAGGLARVSPQRRGGCR